VCELALPLWPSGAPSSCWWRAGGSAARHREQQGDLVAVPQRPAALQLAAAQYGQRGAKRRRELRVPSAEAVVELADGRAVGQLKRQHGRWRERREA
jgi:hypothetical protein